MIKEYLDKAMHLATYEKLEDGSYFGTIPGFQGLWGNAETLEACRDDLYGALEDWLILSLWLNDENLPVMGKIALVPKKMAAAKRRNGTTEPARARKAS
jgi:predicted RNase H-like HicB family nuclease